MEAKSMACNEQDEKTEEEKDSSQTLALDKINNFLRHPDWLFDWYLLQLDRRPIATRCWTSAIAGALGALLTARTVPKKHPRKPPSIDWLQVLCFGLYGGLVGGPVSHRWNAFLQQNFHDSQNFAVLVDQLIGQPPQIMLMFVFLDLAKSAITNVPNAASLAWTKLGTALATSWRLWPLSIYVFLRLLKRRKYFTAAMTACQVAWMALLAKQHTAQPAIFSLTK